MQRIPILTFHSVMNHDKKRNWSFLSVSVEAFENTLKYLKKKGYKTISLQELYDLKTRKIKSNEQKLIIIHFDDGFLDNYTIAYPMLKKYGFKATVFVSPDFVDPRPIIREQTYDKILKGEKINLTENWGYMSWEELKEIDRSGVIDVQGHAMSHTWYPAGPKLVDIHHKSDKYYWLWWNVFKEEKPLWLTKYLDEDVEIGTPVFQFEKSIAAKRFFVTDAVNKFIMDKYRETNISDYNERRKFVSDLNNRIKEKFIDGIGRFETDEEYYKRLIEEIQTSKKIIEERLDKQVRFLAWPGGGNNTLAQQIARDAGFYSVTKKGKAYNELTDAPFYFYRVGGWSGIKIMNKPCLIIERLFIMMQLYRSKGDKYLLNRLFSLIGNVHRYRNINIKR